MGGNEFILYNLVEKESASGFFKNERLLVLNTREESVGYCNKVPEGLIPFEWEEEVKGQIKESVVLRGRTAMCEADGFKVTLRVGGEQPVEWAFHFAGALVVKEWFKHLSLLASGDRNQIDAAYHYVPPPPPVPFDEISELADYSNASVDDVKPTD